MEGSKPLQKIRKKTSLVIIGIAAVLTVMLLLLWVNISNSRQSMPALYPDVYFSGEYRLGDGPWNTVEAGQHIPATKGDVTLRGQFHMVAPNGEYIGVAGEGVLLAFYLNHIHLTVEEEGREPHIMDIEADYAGEGMCGELSIGYERQTDQPVTLTFHDPHTFGNDRAIDMFLEELSVYGGLYYEKNFMNRGALERNAGLGFVIVAFVLLGTALFSALLHTGGSGEMSLIGMSILFAGGYFAYGAKGVFFWSDSIIGNTTALGVCMMLYALCVCALIASLLGPKPQKAGFGAVIFAGIASMVMAVLCLATDIRFYDTWRWWAVIQSVANAALLVCLVLDSLKAKFTRKIRNIGAGILLCGMEADFLGTALGWWQDGLVSRFVFLGLFAIAIVLVWQIIPRNINAARRAKEMEAEQKLIRAQLQENRIAIMISQIQPHFIYNTLGTIQQLCKEDPEQASRLIQNFSMYLRGNFSELDNTMPIRFVKELEHVRCYTEIELIRFPDMKVHYDIQAKEFLLPALTVQPLVENAIKHGLMGLEEGGTVTISAYEEQTAYCVCVSDDGVGFDVSGLTDTKKHIGIRNVRERLQAMCGGSLTIESQPGTGTRVLIRIPKEGEKGYDRNRGR
jgi:signal transduction histidine kinase